MFCSVSRLEMARDMQDILVRGIVSSWISSASSSRRYTRVEITCITTDGKLPDALGAMEVRHRHAPAVVKGAASAPRDVVPSLTERSVELWGPYHVVGRQNRRCHVNVHQNVRLSKQRALLASDRNPPRVKGSRSSRWRKVALFRFEHGVWSTRR